MNLLKKIHEIEIKVDNFLNLTSECGILLQQVVRQYLAGSIEDCEQKLAKIRENELLADSLRVKIERYIYSHTLIPESRGDVFGILEMTDTVIDQIKIIISDMLIERPTYPVFIHIPLQELTLSSANSVDEMVKAVRAFFYNVHDVENYVHKVLFFEKEADDLADRTKKNLYQSTLDLSHKNHVKYFIHGIEKISDFAQDVADRLMIYTMKREL